MLALSRVQALSMICGTAISLVAITVPAHAVRRDDGTSHGNHTSGGTEEQKISASAGSVTFDHSKNGPGADVASVTPVGDWTPPACWYAPKYTPKQFKNAKEAVWSSGSTGHGWDLEERERYAEGKPYENFNLKKSGEGYWWGSYFDQTLPPGWNSCNKPYFWVDKGEPPPADVPNAVTPEVLAKLAYAEIRVPDTDIELSPPNEQKVNLPTWVWLDDSEFQPVSVTASVPVLDISATTTATPVSLHIEPGTEDAKLHPSSGTCPINEDGSIGTPYTDGSSDETPPCGLTYLRASGDQPYKMRATITWEISWQGSGNTGGDLPDGTFGTTQNITVKEIQSIVR